MAVKKKPTQKRVVAKTRTGRGITGVRAGKTIKNTIKKDRKLITIGAIVAVVVVAGLFWWLLGGGSRVTIQHDMNAYLKDKYGKDFTVNLPKLTGTGLGITGSWKADAHPKDDPTLVFGVRRDQEKEVFADTYTGAVWAREETPRVETFIKEISPDQVPAISLDVGISMNKNEPNPIRGSVPSIDEAIKKYSNEFFYGLGIEFTEKEELTEHQKSEYVSKIKSIASYVDERGAKLTSVDFIIKLPDNTHYRCKTGYFYQSPVYNIETCLDKKQ